MTSRAVILAAGQGTRLRPLTDDVPKCLVHLAGRPLLERQLHVLREAGIEDITVVGGYRAEALEGRGCRVLLNPRFAETNMVHTLFRAREVLQDDADLVVSYGDIVFEPRVLEALLASRAGVAVTIDRCWRRYWQLRMEDPLSDAETLKLDAQGRILELGKKPRDLSEIQGQYMGLFKVAADRVGDFVRAHDELPPDGVFDGRDLDNMYMTSFLQHLIDSGWPVEAVPVDGGWLETDTVDDLALYHRMRDEGTLSELCRLD